MRKRQTEEITAQIDGVRHEVAQVRDAVVQKLERLDAWLIVHDPSTRHAAEAYEGLRKQLGAGAKSRRLHLVDLSKLDDLLRTLADRLETEPDTAANTVLASIRERLDEQLRDAGLAVVEASSDNYWAFDGINGEEPASGTVLETVRPGYVDISGEAPIAIRRGEACVVEPELQSSMTPQSVTEGTDLESPGGAVAGDDLSADDEASRSSVPMVLDTKMSPEPGRPSPSSTVNGETDS